METDLPYVIEKDLHRRDRNHIEGVNKNHIHKSPTGQIRYRSEKNPEDSEGSQTAEEHSDRANNKIDPILHARLDILHFYHEINVYIFAQGTQISLHSHEGLL